MNINNDSLEMLRSMCKTITYNGSTSDEYLFTVHCANYFFYNKNISAPIIDDALTDGPGDGGIDYIYADSSKVYLLQGKTQDKISYNDVRDIFQKMRETYENLSNGEDSRYNERLKQIFKNIFDSYSNEPDVEFVLFTCAPIDEDLRNEINKLANKPEYMNYTLSVYGDNEITARELSIDNGNMSISEGILKLDIAKNALYYDEKKGAIFTIKANSLKDLYTKYSNSGLFGYNLREHISEKKVDSDIDETINNSPEDFWFLNNGITIGCSDYSPDGDVLRLYDFSIINGAQTTYKIGTSKRVNKEHDFSLVCKVIRSEKSLEDIFIRKISEASNSQKPIKARDLRSNSLEQQLLQKKARDNSKHQLAIDIKRGVKPQNSKYVESWQRVSNEYLGQLIWACDYQCPGSARSCKSDIFGKTKVYNLLFSRDKVNNYNYDTLFDLVKLGHYYDQFKLNYKEKIAEQIAKATSEVQKKKLQDKNIMCQNAKFTVLALLSYFYKIHYMKIKPGDKALKEQNLNSPLTLNYPKDDFVQRLEYIFEYYISILSVIYDDNQVAYSLTSQSNFLKTDANYDDLIIPAFLDKYEDLYESGTFIKSLEIFK